MMTCEELIGFLTDYFDGQLSLAQRASFQFHLTLCRHCRDYLHNFETTIEATRQAGRSMAEEPVEPLPEELVQAILASRRSSGS